MRLSRLLGATPALLLPGYFLAVGSVLIGVVFAVAGCFLLLPASVLDKARQRRAGRSNKQNAMELEMFFGSALLLGVGVVVYTYHRIQVRAPNAVLAFVLSLVVPLASLSALVKIVRFARRLPTDGSALCSAPRVENSDE